ncbi:MAG: CPBP family intramembrane metalloprotease [Oscillospiraceae bacterium]|nr:CPBP family intramembrane metalloprotease [Oscillospiraceae bacterium]
MESKSKKIKSLFEALLIPLIYVAALYVIQGLLESVVYIASLIINPNHAGIISYNANMLILILSFFGAFGLASLFVKKRFAVKLFVAKKFDIRLFLSSIILGLACYYFTAYLAFILFPSGKPPENAVLEELTFMTALAAIVAAPVCEEIVMRRFMIEACYSRKLSPLVFIVLSSLIFALMHDPGSGAYMTVTFFVGVVLAFCYHNSGIVLYVITAHSAFNALSFVMTYIDGSSYEAPIAEFVMETSDYFYFFASAVLIALVMFAFVKLGRRELK